MLSQHNQSHTSWSNETLRETDKDKPNWLKTGKTGSPNTNVFDRRGWRGLSGRTEGVFVVVAVWCVVGSAQ